MMRERAFSPLHAPTPLDLEGKSVLVLGFGDTGHSVARWVQHEGGRVRAADTRTSPPRANDFQGELHTGPLGPSLLEGIDLVCISPGLPLAQPIVAGAKAKGIPVVGDIELFAWHVRRETQSKVIAVTGTNGKTTVTALTAWLLSEGDVYSVSAGNIGPPALSALMDCDTKPEPDVWVLELSSYQLETTWSLAPDAAAMLNLTEDHLDRYGDMQEYAAAKARIFCGDGIQVLNRDDPRSLAMARPGSARMTFGLDAPQRVMDFGLADGQLVQGTQPILPLEELSIRGMHNAANALAACALARAMGLPLESLQKGLRRFQGLPHRLQLVATCGGVQWYDDSKGTNVGATVAALTGLRKPVLLIAGGEGKGQDFSPLARPVSQFAKRVLLIGRDAPLIDQALGSTGVPVSHCASLEEAVEQAARAAAPGDAVLLSPACASFDMFRDYRHRGEVFAAAVKRLAA
jgi:UDP-N-acetylmuramoylalanine--D-glutamate ligase